MRLAEGVATGDEGDGLLVVHGHPPEGLTDVASRRDRVGVAVGALGVDVDQAHLHRADRTGELPLAAVALVSEPGVLGTPEDLLGLPDVLAAEAEPEGLEAHRLQGDVPGEHQQVGPRDLLAVLLLDRPEQATGLVEVGVVGPAVERGEALGAVTGAAAAVLDAVGAGSVPAEPDEQAAVVAEVGRPPVLRGGHHLDEVLLHGLDVEVLERLGVVETRTEGVRARGVLVEDLEVQLVGPPVPVGVRPPIRLGLGGGDYRVLALAAVCRHVSPSPVSVVVGLGVVCALSGLVPPQRTRGRCPSR